MSIDSNLIAVRLQFSTKPNLVAPLLRWPDVVLLSPQGTLLPIPSHCRYKILPIASLQNHNLSWKKRHKKFGEEANFGSDNKEIPGRTTEKISTSFSMTPTRCPSIFASSNLNPLHEYSIILQSNKLNPIQERAFESCSYAIYRHGVSGLDFWNPLYFNVNAMGH